MKLESQRSLPLTLTAWLLTFAICSASISIPVGAQVLRIDDDVREESLPEMAPLPEGLSEDENGKMVTRYVNTERLSTSYDPAVPDISGQVVAYSDRVTDWAVENDTGIVLRDLLTLIDRTNITLDGFTETKTATG